MLQRLREHLTYANVMATLAVFLVLAGGTAWATHEVINSSDVVNESLTGADIQNGTLTGADVFNNTISGADITNGSLTGADVFDNTLGGADITNGSLTGADIANESIGAADIGSQQVGPDEVINDSLLQSDIRAGAVTGDEVLDNSLTGTDINESTLNMPPTTTATFAGTGHVSLRFNNDVFTKVVSKNLPAGSWAIVATVNTHAGPFDTGNLVRELVCELRNGSGFIGGATDRQIIPGGDTAKRSLTMNGGAQVPAGGGEVSVWCHGQSNSDDVDSSQMMMIRLDGFS
jgi:hypothetical protein